jgi:hypothetical protein
MSRFSIFQAPILAFYSRAFYSDVTRGWRGTGFGYLLLLLAFSLLPILYAMHLRVATFMEADFGRLAAQTPAITIRGGEATIAVPQPHTIRDPDSGRAVAILDTTGEVNDLTGQEAALLLTKSELRVRALGTATRTIRLSDLPDATVTPDWLEEKGRSLARWLLPIVYPFSVAGAFLGRALQALIYAAMGAVMARAIGLGLRFGALLRLSVVAMTPALLIGTGLSLANVAKAHTPLWEPVLTMGYLLLGLRASTQPREVTPAESP